jgi:CheY-like chemotaxis protein
MQTDIITALIVDRDRQTTSRLRRSLEELGYAVLEADETEVALEMLAEEASSFVTFFGVELPRNRMSGMDHADLIGALLRDTRLGERHAFIAVSEDPETVEVILGRLLERLSVPIISRPTGLDALRAAMARAVAHLVSAPALAL